MNKLIIDVENELSSGGGDIPYELGFKLLKQYKKLKRERITPKTVGKIMAAVTIAAIEVSLDHINKDKKIYSDTDKVCNEILRTIHYKTRNEP